MKGLSDLIAFFTGARAPLKQALEEANAAKQGLRRAVANLKSEPIDMLNAVSKVAKDG